MRRMIRKRLSTSILNADFGNLGAVFREIERHSDMVHLDIMDGHFVPNITFGPLVVSTIRKITKLPLECHLMIYEPEEWLETFTRAGADRLAVHLRACRDPGMVLDSIKHHGVSPGLAISPGTPLFELRPYLERVDFVVVMCVYPGFGGQKIIPEMLERVSQLQDEALELDLDLEIEVDGGIKSHNIDLVLGAGADTVVVGSSIFKSDDISLAAETIKARISEFSENAEQMNDHPWSTVG